MTTAILDFRPLVAGIDACPAAPANAARLLVLAHPAANGRRLVCHWQVESGRLACHWSRDSAQDPPSH